LFDDYYFVFKIILSLIIDIALMQRKKAYREFRQAFSNIFI